MKKIIFIIIIICSSLEFSFSQSGWTLQPNNIVPKGFFKNNNSVYIACEGGVVYKSSDNGANWRSIRQQDGNYLNSVFFMNELTGITGGSYVFKTTDGGINWFQVYSTGRSINSIAFINENTGYLIGGDVYPYNIFLKTTNGGNNYTSLNIGTNLPFRCIQFLDNSIGYIVGDSSLIMKTTDGGQTWLRQITFSPIKLNCVQFINLNMGWTAGENGKVYFTSNSGLNWILESTNSNLNIHQIYFLNSLQGICCLDSGRILLTSNGGQIWQTKYLNSRQNYYAGYFKDTSTVLAFGGLSIGGYGFDNYREYSCYTSANNGSSWDSLMSGTNTYLKCLFFVDTLVGYVGGDGYYPPSYVNVGSITKTTNGGNTWILQNTGISSEITSLFFLNNNTGWGLGYYGQCIRTINGGANWLLMANNVVAGYENNIYFFDTSKGFSVSGNLKVTTDGGFTWAIVNGINSVYKLSFINNRFGWLVGGSSNPYNSYSRIYNTTDGGVTWNLQSLPINYLISSVNFVDSINGWAASDDITHSRGIYHTSDGGINWNLVNNRAVVKVFFINSNTGYYGSNNSAIYKTTDAGYNWYSVFNQESSRFWWDIQFVNERNGWAVAEGEYGGYIAHTSTGGEPIGIQPITSEIPQSFALHQNYPNPFNPTTTMRFDLPVSENVTLKIYDILGREVAVLINNELRNANSYQVSWDATNFASGIYFYKITAGDFSQSKKMVLVK